MYRCNMSSVYTVFGALSIKNTFKSGRTWEQAFSAKKPEITGKTGISTEKYLTKPFF